MHLPQRPMRGILLFCLAMAIFPLLDVLAKILGQQGIPIIQIVWARLFFGAIMLAPLVWKTTGWNGFAVHHFKLNLLRGALILCGTGCFFAALLYQGVAETLAIFFVQPLIITLLSPAILGEHVGVRRWVAVCVGFVGTLIIIRPGFQQFNPGIILALGAGFFSGIFLLVTRLLAQRQSAILNTFHTNIAGTMLASVVVGFFWIWPSQPQWGLLLLLAIVGTLSNFIVMMAYQYADASLLAPFGYTEMITATLAGWVFFHDMPDGWTFVGVGILIASAIYISRREYLLQRRIVRE